MLRRLVVPAATVLLLSPLGAVTAHAADAPGHGASESGAQAATKAKPKKNKQSKACAARVKKRTKKVAAKKFAKCTIQGMKRGRTVRITTSYDDGRRGTGPYRFGKTTDASVKANDGTAQIALGKDFYLKSPDTGWVKGKANGTPEEQMAHTTGVLWRAMSRPAHYRKVLASSKGGWKRVGNARKVNGVKAIRYDGKPSVLGVEVDSYRIWLDKQDRAIKIVSKSTAYGETVTMTQDWRKWGKKVSITAPDMD